MRRQRSDVVTLSDNVLARCRDHGSQIVDGYRAGLNPASRAVSSHGAESNINLQAAAKMAECAFCMWASADIELLNWSRGVDSGFDVVLWDGFRIDVKNTGAKSQFLIWPINKNDFYHKKPFDLFVLVKSKPPEFLIAGWISKSTFAEQHEVAGAGHALSLGTWFMSEVALLPPDSLLKAAAA